MNENTNSHENLGGALDTIAKLQNRVEELTNKNNELELALEAEQAKSKSLGAVIRVADESLAAWSTKVDKARKLMQTAIDNGEFDDEIEEIWLEELAAILGFDTKRTEQFEVELTISVTVAGTKPRGYELSTDDFTFDLDIQTYGDDIEIEMQYAEQFDSLREQI